MVERPYRPRPLRPLAFVAPIAPSETGEFPAGIGRVGAPMMLAVKQVMASRPVGVDAMVLRDDLRRAIQRRKGTALLDACDSGLGLFCAAHVSGELEGHLPEWVRDLTDPTEGRRLFERHYLRQLRVVSVPSGALRPDEAARVAALRATGSKDWPTATLALLLNAPILTRDKRLLRAVYGDSADVDALTNWL